MIDGTTSTTHTKTKQKQGAQKEHSTDKKKRDCHTTTQHILTLHHIICKRSDNYLCEQEVKNHPMMASTLTSHRRKSLVMIIPFFWIFLVTTTTTTHAFSIPATSTKGGNRRVATQNSMLPLEACKSSSSFQFATNSIPRGGGRSGTTLEASAAASNEIRNVDTRKMLTASVIVGAVTAAMGFLYGKILGVCVHTVWNIFPSFVKSKLPFHPKYLILSICTLGGTLMGILSSLLPNTFTVADFVHAFSSSFNKSLPQSRASLLPLLLLSLVTSTFGFSVGPEAPMVCAGALVGSSLGRRFYKNNKDNSDDTSSSASTVLAYAGAAGALTAFMGIPIAGSIFALELPKSTAGFSSNGGEALSPAVAASVAALLVIRAILVPSKTVGGHFSYAAATGGGATKLILGGRTMILAALGSGIGGALLGTTFHKLVTFLKGVFWSTMKPKETPSSPPKAKKWKQEVFIKTLVGVLVGVISMMYPQTLFWGEGSLQCMIDGQHTAFEATKHGLASWFTTGAKVNPNIPFPTTWAATQVGIAKLLAIALACAGKFPGGIIFPLFFAAAPFAHAVALAGGGLFGGGGSALLPVIVMCLMAATQASVTRTPLATAFILTLSASANTELSVMLPACLLSSYVGVWVSQFLSKNSYFKYNDNTN